jgi:hypothetical protein
VALEPLEDGQASWVRERAHRRCVADLEVAELVDIRHDARLQDVT